MIINLGWYCSTFAIFKKLQDQVMGHFCTLMLKYTNIYHMAMQILMLRRSPTNGIIRICALEGRGGSLHTILGTCKVPLMGLGHKKTIEPMLSALCKTQ